MSSEKQSKSESKTKTNVWVWLAFRTGNEPYAKIPDIEVSLEEAPIEIEEFYGNVNKLKKEIRKEKKITLKNIEANLLTIYRNVELPKDKKRTFRLSASNAEELDAMQVISELTEKLADKEILLCVAPFLPNVSHSERVYAYCSSVVFGIVLLLTTLHLLL